MRRLQPAKNWSDEAMKTSFVSLHRFSSASLHRFIPSSLRPFIASSLHLFIPPSFHPFVTSSLRHLIPSSPHPFVTSSLHTFIPSSLHPFIASSASTLLVPSSGCQLGFMFNFTCTSLPFDMYLRSKLKDSSLTRGTHLRTLPHFAPVPSQAALPDSLPLKLIRVI